MEQERLEEQQLQPEQVLQAIEEKLQGVKVAEQQLQVEQGLQPIEDEVEQDLQTENVALEQQLQVEQGLQPIEDKVEQDLQTENVALEQQLQPEQVIQAIEEETKEEKVQEQQLQEEQGLQPLEDDIEQDLLAENIAVEQQLQIEQGSQVEEDELEPELLCAICLDNAKNNDFRVCGCHYKIHHECLKMTLLSWKKSPLHNFTALQCVGCSTIMNIKLQPPKTALVEDMENVARKYKLLCKKLVKFGKVIIVHQALTTHGLAVLHQIYGREKASDIANSLGPVVSVLLCQTIPLITLGISFSHWEEKLLTGLRRCSLLPLVGRLFPQEYPGVIEPVYRTGTWLTTVVDGLLLPWYGGACGLLLCGFSDSGLRRLLLGTSVFLSVRALFYMYCRQKRYYYLGNRTVANYENW